MVRWVGLGVVMVSNVMKAKEMVMMMMNLLRPETLRLKGTSTKLHDFSSFNSAMISYKPIQMPFSMLSNASL